MKRYRPGIASTFSADPNYERPERSFPFCDRGTNQPVLPHKTLHHLHRDYRQTDVVVPLASETNRILVGLRAEVPQRTDK